MREIYNEQVRDRESGGEGVVVEGGNSGAPREGEPSEGAGRGGIAEVWGRRRSAAAEEDDAPTVTRRGARRRAHPRYHGGGHRASRLRRNRAERTVESVAQRRDGVCEGVGGAGRVVSGRLHLIDLAGRARRALGLHGARLPEAQHITRPLRAGRRHRRAPGERAHVPFATRNSRVSCRTASAETPRLCCWHTSPPRRRRFQRRSPRCCSDRDAVRWSWARRVNVAGSSGTSAADAALASSLAKCRRALEEERARASTAEAKAAALGAEIEAVRANAETRAVVGANHTARLARSMENAEGASAAESAATQTLSPIEDQQLVAGSPRRPFDRSPRRSAPSVASPRTRRRPSQGVLSRLCTWGDDGRDATMACERFETRAIILRCEKSAPQS